MPKITITLNEVSVENKFGIYGEDDEGQGKSISSVISFGGTIEPGGEMGQIIPQVDALMDQAFAIAKGAVERASKEDKGW